MGICCRFLKLVAIGFNLLMLSDKLGWFNFLTFSDGGGVIVYNFLTLHDRDLKKKLLWSMTEVGEGYKFTDFT